MEVETDENLEAKHKGLYIIGDGSGVTHSLSHASASGVHVEGIFWKNTYSCSASCQVLPLSQDIIFIKNRMRLAVF